MSNQVPNSIDHVGCRIGRQPRGHAREGGRVDEVQRGQVIEMGDVGHDEVATLDDVLDYPAVVRDCGGNNRQPYRRLHLMFPDRW